MIFLARASSACPHAIEQEPNANHAMASAFVNAVFFMLNAYANVSAQMLRAHAMA